MTEVLVKYNTAVLAKEKGFDGFSCCDDKWLINDKIGLFKEWKGLSPYIAEGCDTIYRPSQSLLQKWLRDKKIHIDVVYERGVWCYILHQLPSEEDIKFAASGECEDGDLWLLSNTINSDWYTMEYKSYEEALEAGLLESLKLV